MALVSIIVPIYNVEPYLSACIDSVLNQTCRDFELILVDDGSPDNCGIICDAYAEKDCRIRVVHKPNGGLSDARNAGLDVATGKYIYFLDGDDSIRPNLLEILIPIMEKGADLAAFTFQGFYDDGRQQVPWVHETGEYDLDSPEKKQDFLHKILLQGKIGWDAWSRMFVREKIERYGLRFADNRKIFAEDLYFSLCYCAHADRVISIDDCLYNYRLRSDSIMGVQNTRNNLPRIMVLADAVQSYYSRFADCALLRNDFSRLWYQIIMNQFMYQILNVQDPEDFRGLIIREMPDWDKVSSLIRRQLKDTAFWKKQYSFVRYFEVTANARFLLDGNLWAFRVACWIARRIKNQYERFGYLVP